MRYGEHTRRRSRIEERYQLIVSSGRLRRTTWRFVGFKSGPPLAGLSLLGNHQDQQPIRKESDRCMIFRTATNKNRATVVHTAA